MNKTHAVGLVLMVFGFTTVLVASFGVPLHPVFGLLAIGGFFVGLFIELVGHTHSK